MLKEKITAEGYTFDDLLLVPSYSEVVPIQVKLDTKLTKKISLAIPVLSAAMDTVTESTMAIALARLGGLGIIHKNMSIEDQVKEIALVKQVTFSESEATKDEFGRLRVGAAVGVSKNTLERIDALVSAGVDIIAVDSAHGHSKGVIRPP